MKTIGTSLPDVNVAVASTCGESVVLAVRKIQCYRYLPRNYAKDKIKILFLFFHYKKSFFYLLKENSIQLSTIKNNAIKTAP
jgi:hypothetical protein